VYFIGLTFHQNFVQFKKIDSFRRQFDPHYNHCKMLQMTILPPFELPFKGKHAPAKKGIEALGKILSEDLESNFFGQEHPLRLDFQQIDFSFNKKPMIYLSAKLPEELIYAQECLAQSLEDWEVKFKRRGKKFYETVLPIGRPKREYVLRQAVSTARSDFDFPLSLYVSGIVLFEKVPGYWPVVKRIYHCDVDIEEMRSNEFGIRQERDQWSECI
jgi:hypothetical protein